MFEAGAESWDERFQELSVFADFREEAESCATDVFVRMLLVWISLGCYEEEN